MGHDESDQHYLQTVLCYFYNMHNQGGHNNHDSTFEDWEEEWTYLYWQIKQLITTEKR